LNEETDDDLLQNTGMNDTKYAIALSLFSLAILSVRSVKQLGYETLRATESMVGDVVALLGFVDDWICGCTEYYYCCCFEMFDWGV
jgi:hypothetical protein